MPCAVLTQSTNTSNTTKLHPPQGQVTAANQLIKQPGSALEKAGISTLLCHFLMAYVLGGNTGPKNVVLEQSGGEVSAETPPKSCERELQSGKAHAGHSQEAS